MASSCPSPPFALIHKHIYYVTQDDNDDTAFSYLDEYMQWNTCVSCVSLFVSAGIRAFLMNSTVTVCDEREKVFFM